MEDDFVNNLVLTEEPELTEEMKIALNSQCSRMVTEFKAEKLEKEAKKNWDTFYKRNETRFFKDRLALIA
jgi:methyltransferase-like protein 6